MTQFNIPEKIKRKPINRIIIVSPGTELYPFVFDQHGNKRNSEEMLSIMLYASDSVISTAIAKGLIDRNPVEAFEQAHNKEVLENFIYNKKASNG